MMIIAIVDPGTGTGFLPVLRQVDPELSEQKYQAQSNEELVASSPELLVLAHRMALVQCKAIRDVPGGEKLRILVLFPDDAPNIINARIAGADAAMVIPEDPQELFHTFRNESIASRRRREAQELIDSGELVEGRYLLKKLLGISLRAVVFLAEDREKNKIVTVKLIRKLVATQESVIEEWRRKAKKLKGVASASMVDLLDFGSWQGQPYLIFDIGEAKNLYQILAARRLSEVELAQIALDITRALLTMKHFKMLHMDIKPENILFYEGKYYLAEFGVLIPSGAPKDNTGFPYWSTSEFSCPELFFENAMLTARSDAYSLGLLLYTLVERNNPFAGYQATKICSRHMGMESLRPTDADPKLSQTLSVAIEAMTLLRPSARPRLRDMEIIFYQFLALKNGQYPKEPVGQSQISVAGKKDDSERASKIISHNVVEEAVQRERRVAPGRNPNRMLGSGERRPGRRVEKTDGISKALLRKILIIGGAVFVLMASGMYFIYQKSRPMRFNQGPEVMFTCYYEHTVKMRTLDLRNARCPKCNDLTSPSFTCRNRRCKKIFGLSHWPKRDMSEQECKEFEKKLHNCPFCKSGNIVPTPFPKPPPKPQRGRKVAAKPAKK